VAKLVRVPDGAAGTTVYTLAPGEAWTLDSLIFTINAPLATPQVMPTLTFRDQSGHVIGRAAAPLFFP
jgi:hypothetical protein